mmetsp:Transcript_12133/g.36603  ORF Transcript_12133/g.36603 Transcript_12133/m.36603 type:complete len:117 (-) Transcript_12133:120-470(-)
MPGRVVHRLLGASAGRASTGAEDARSGAPVALVAPLMGADAREHEPVAATEEHFEQVALMAGGFWGVGGGGRGGACVGVRSAVGGKELAGAGTASLVSLAACARLKSRVFAGSPAA